MKKFIVLLLSMVLAFSINAQTTTISVGNGTYVEKSTGFLLSNAVAQWTLIKGQADWITSFDYQIHLDSTSGNHTNVAVAVYGRKFSNDSWTAIGSAINWKGTSVDTTITISTTSGARWREYKALVTGTGTGTTTISEQKFKLWFQ